ncbi:hypothetical protein K8T06_16605 [bacterium]|nr:hypothetical protein [bacterium]
MYQDWTIQVDSRTVFIPMDGDLPNPFYYDDLEVGKPVLVQGEPVYGQYRINAETVFVFSSMNQAAQKRNAPLGDSVFGPVNLITPSKLTFNVWVDASQGDYLDVRVLPGSEFWHAPVGQSRVPMNSIFDFLPGDPIMIHGYRYNDLYRGSVFVRSNDWFSSESGRNDLEIMEVYGWVDNVYYSQQGDQFVLVCVDTVTGDPNHQTFSKVVGPEGDQVHFPWGHLDIPSGALNISTEIVVSGDFMFWWTLQNTYDFQPSLEFSIPVDIEIRYFNLNGIHPDRVKLTYYDEEAQCWQIACHMTHVPDEHCFRGQIEHFSRYSLSTNNRPLQGASLDQN